MAWGLAAGAPEHSAAAAPFLSAASASDGDGGCSARGVGAPAVSVKLMTYVSKYYIYMSIVIVI